MSSSSSARVPLPLVNLPVSHRFKFHSLYGAVLLLILACLTYLYRLGGFVDGFDPQARYQSLRDYRVWISGGENLWNGQNPFEIDEILKSGVFSSQTIFLIRQIFPNPQSFFSTFQFLNLTALLFFLWQNRLLTKKFTFISFALVLSSSTREILVNGQITGLMLGVFALLQRYLPTSIHGASKYLPFRFASITQNIVCGLAIFFLLDIKPNVTLFPILLLIIHTKNYSACYSGFILWISHLIFSSLIVGNNLLISWYQNLTNVTSYEKNSDLFGSLGIWQVLNTISLSPSLFEILPVLSFVLIGFVSIRILKRGKVEISLLFAFLANYFYSYFHFYSYFPILAFVFYELLRNRNNFALGLSISSMFLSFNSEIFKSTMFSLGFLVMIFLFFRFERINDAVCFACGWITFLTYKWLLNTVIGLEQLHAKALIAAIPVLTYLSILAVERLKTLIGERT